MLVEYGFYGCLMVIYMLWIFVWVWFVFVDLEGIDRDVVLMM